MKSNERKAFERLLRAATEEAEIPACLIDMLIECCADGEEGLSIQKSTRDGLLYAIEKILREYRIFCSFFQLKKEAEGISAIARIVPLLGNCTEREIRKLAKFAEAAERSAQFQ